MGQNNATRAFLNKKSNRAGSLITLDDIQPMWGGRQIILTGSGQATIRIVEHGLVERRYEITISPVDLQRIFAAIIENDFLTIQPADRPGLPDEARPKITLANAGGETHAVEKWAGVKDARFDMIYVALVQLEALTVGIEPAYSGPYSTI
jgi:hypothetical protein